MEVNTRKMEQVAKKGRQSAPSTALSTPQSAVKWRWKAAVIGGCCVGCQRWCTAAMARVVGYNPAVLSCAHDPPLLASAAFVCIACCSLAIWRLWSDRQTLFEFAVGGSIDYTPERRDILDLTDSSLLIGFAALLVTFTAYGEHISRHIPLFGDSLVEQTFGLSMGDALGVAKCMVGEWLGVVDGAQAGTELDLASVLSAVVSFFGLLYTIMEHLEGHWTRWVKRREFERHRQGGMGLLHKIDTARPHEPFYEQDLKQAETAFKLAAEYCDLESMKKEMNHYALRFGFRQRGFVRPTVPCHLRLVRLLDTFDADEAARNRLLSCFPSGI